MTYQKNNSPIFVAQKSLERKMTQKLNYVILTVVGIIVEREFWDLVPNEGKSFDDTKVSQRDREEKKF